MRVFKEGVLLALAVLLTLAVAPVTAEPPNKYPLHKAVRDGDLDRLVELLQTGHNQNEVDEFGQTALLCSARWNQDRRYLYTSKLLEMGIYLTQVLGNSPYMLWSSVARVAVPPTSDL